MALRAPRLGYDRSLDPALGVPDSGFDPLARPRRADLSAVTPGINSESVTGITPIRGTPPPQPPPVQPPVPFQPPAPPPAVPTGAPGPPTTYNPQLLNFEGSTYGGPQVGEQQPYTPKYSQLTPADQESVRRIVEDVLGKQYGYDLGDWRTKLETDPTYWESLKNRLGPGASGLVTSILSKYSNPGINQGAAIQYLGQAAYNQSVTRLKEVNSIGARDDEEQLVAVLASRGLSNSGIAAAEIEKLHQARLNNFYEAANSLNQLLLSGEITRLTARDLAQLEADLQKRNAESLARIQGQLALEQIKAGQPSELAQLLGTAGGVALPFLLPTAKAPGAETTPQLYGAPGVNPTNPRRNSYVEPQFNP